MQWKSLHAGTHRAPTPPFGRTMKAEEARLSPQGHRSSRGFWERWRLQGLVQPSTAGWTPGRRSSLRFPPPSLALPSAGQLCAPGIKRKMFFYISVCVQKIPPPPHTHIYIKERFLRKAPIRLDLMSLLNNSKPIKPKPQITPQNIKIALIKLQLLIA